jgi:sugar phosphate permease
MLKLKQPTKVLLLGWVAYAIFYFMRVNFSIAIPGIIEEFNLSKTALGTALSAFFILYAIGQFINGQLADNIGPKKMLAIGLLGTILINLLIPQFGGLVSILTIVWGINGLLQSMGWSPNVKIVSAWFPKEEKGRAAGILGTSYIIGGALSWILAGYLARFGWRTVFYIPAIMGLFVLQLWLLKAKENPENKKEKTNLKETLEAVLTNKTVWFAGMGLFGLNIVRYGFLDWAPTYFFETQQANITTATYKALIFPLFGALGSLSMGWLTDKVFKNIRTLAGLIMSIILAISAILFASTVNWIFGLILLAIIGFTTFGPHSLLVTQLPMILGNRKNTASITGFIDALGYLGASLTGIISGILIDNFGWNYTFYFWVSGALIAGIFIYKANKK